MIKNITTDIKTILAEKLLIGNSHIWQQKLEAVTNRNVEKVLSGPPGTTGTYSLEKLVTLISPAAEDYIELMAQKAHRLTVQRFGRTIRLYAPLYLSNYCTNSCLYCGFNQNNKFHRTRLTIDQAVEEAERIACEGFRDILLVSGEDKNSISIKYLTKLAERLRKKFSSISVEVYPMNTAEYSELLKAGIDGVTLYQETYDHQIYRYYHPAGPKSNYDDRLDALDRIARAGMREIGMGALLGLANWRLETLALAEHAHFLIKQYWRSHVSFSFPRLRPAYKVNGLQFKHLPSDKNIVQMITALRLCFADAGLVLSTREPAQLRDNLIRIGITKLSAGSKTNPGGYSNLNKTTEQFEVNDDRSPSQVAAMIKRAGFEPVWKDWDIVLPSEVQNKNL